MGQREVYQDERARGDWARAFEAARIILDRKGSKGLMVGWIEACMESLGEPGELGQLPEYFWDLSVYGRREALGKVRLPQVQEKEATC